MSDIEDARPPVPVTSVRVICPPRVLPRLVGKHPELIGKELHYSEQPVMLMGVPGRASDGTGSIAVVIRREDGTYTVGEMTLRGLLQAAATFDAEFAPAPAVSE